MPTGKRPTEDYMGKVTLMPNLSYLFSAGTISKSSLQVSNVFLDFSNFSFLP